LIAEIIHAELPFSMHLCEKIVLHLRLHVNGEKLYSIVIPGLTQNLKEKIMDEAWDDRQGIVSA